MSSARIPSKQSKKVLQLKIILLGTTPKIWRRIHIPANFTFAQLHTTIRHAMDWMEGEFHVFQANNSKTRTQDLIGIPPKFEDNWNFFGPEVYDEDKMAVYNYLNNENKTLHYLYDFEDGSWKMKIILEKKLLRESDEKYPRCVDGRCSTPSEILGIICALDEFDPKFAFASFPY
uniref:Plasmid pRiA4b Orf3-like domain-containing protein n=1 Tax=Strigamia maritima TaxID=126957 RepID=T1JA37_STRMM